LYWLLLLLGLSVRVSGPRRIGSFFPGGGEDVAVGLRHLSSGLSGQLSYHLVRSLSPW